MADYVMLTLDVVDVELQTAFWCGALGYEHRGDANQYRVLVDPTGVVPRMLLQQVIEHKTAKNRLHIDIHVVDVEAEATRLEALGATRVGSVAENGIVWITMRDPEGNELCVVPS